ncbi:MAG TPA: hypothetical protein VF365_10330 [Candidatus Limnocylindria bacterium]
MTDLDALRRAALVGVALAVVVGIAATPMYMAAFGWDLESATFVRPEAALEQGPGAAALWRWGFGGDMLFSYLLLTPLALFLHRHLRERRPWLADMGLIGALSYVLIGGASAAILAHAGGSLIEAYHAAAPGDQTAILSSFHLLRDAFVFGVWQTLDGLTAGAWLLSTGLLFLVERPLLGRLLVMLGLWAWTFVAVATIAGIHSLVLLGGGLAVALAIWIVWFAIGRRRVVPRA